MITKDSILKSGDKFSYFGKDLKDYVVEFTLQKLPDFELWILISDKHFNGEHSHWMKPMPTAFGAFGNWENCFKAHQ
jgi:hypothetical protein